MEIKNLLISELIVGHVYSILGFIAEDIIEGTYKGRNDKVRHLFFDVNGRERKVEMGIEGWDKRKNFVCHTPKKIEDKDFNYYLKNFEDTTKSIELSKLLTKQLGERQKIDRNNLVWAVKQEIVKQCSPEFVIEMRKEISRELRTINKFKAKPFSNLQYLAIVICIPLTESSEVTGFDAFIAPGKNYEESAEFCNLFFKDIIRIKEIFRLEIRHRRDIKAGYAYQFYRPE